MDDHPQDGTPPTDDTTRSPAAEGGEVGDSDLLVPWLRIQNFRGFRDLHIPRLGRVNLIVGKNSVGKTSTLDAVRIMFENSMHRSLIAPLRARDEFRIIRFGNETPNSDNYNSITPEIEKLFNGDRELGEKWPEARIISRNFSSTIHFRWKVPSRSSAAIKMTQEKFPHIPAATNASAILVHDRGKYGRWNVVFRRNKNQSINWFAHDVHIERVPEYHLTVPIISIASDGSNDNDSHSLWEKIVLTDYKEIVLNAMRIVFPAVGQIASAQRGGRRAFLARKAGERQISALKNFGEGVFRSFTISLVVANCSHGITLIDEAENGLHWSVHPKLWDLVFHLAESLNVQVFATTHSYDCIKGFAAAARKHPSKGALIRLERQGEDVTARVLDEDAMAYAINEDIEVR